MAEGTNKLRVRLVTPERILFEEMADAVELPSKSGYLEVLYGHAPLVAELGAGDVTVHGGSETATRYNVSWGFAEVLPERVTILANRGVPVAQLDQNTAEEARRAAEDAISKAANPSPEELAELERQLEIVTFRLQAVERDRRRRRD